MCVGVGVISTLLDTVAMAKIQIFKYIFEGK